MGDLQQEAPETRDSIFLGPAPSIPCREDLVAGITNPPTNKAKQNSSTFGRPLGFFSKTSFITKIRPVRNTTNGKKSNGSAKPEQPESGRKIQSIPKTKSQKLWPNPEKSLGDKCNTLASRHGKFQCWQIVGDAGERTRELLEKIINVLDEYSEEIHRDEGPKRSVLAAIFMIGKTEITAGPVLVLSGEKKPRREAMKQVNESKHLDLFYEEHGLKVMMIEAEELPIGRRFQSASGPANPSANASLTSPANLKICYNTDVAMHAISAVKIYLTFGDELERRQESKATVGCLLISDGKYFAWTAGHAFFDIPEFSNDVDSINSSGSEEIEISFDPEHGYEMDDQESDASLTRASQSITAPQLRSVAIPTSYSRVPPGTEVAVQARQFGVLYQNSFTPIPSSRDWALIEITEASFKTEDAIYRINGAHGQIYRDQTPPQKEVSLITSRGWFEGQLSCSPVYISLPPRYKFQELWIVRLKNGMIEKGDCGSLAIDADGVIYGHLIGGDLEKGICYIVPAAQTFEDMKSRGNPNLVLAERSSLVTDHDGDDPGPSAPAFVESSHNYMPTPPNPDFDGVIVEYTISAVPGTPTRDPELGIRSRHGKKPASETSTRPEPPQSDSLPRKYRRLFQRPHFWITPRAALDPVNHIHESSFHQRVITIIDSHGFDRQVFFVAGAGILGASYALHVTAVIMPALAFIYWPDEISPSHATSIRATSLVGVVVGAVVFGYFADLYGRRRLYGLSMQIMLISFLGVVQASAGYNGSMSFLTWFLFWQFVLGIGIGATYVSTAILTAEFAPTASRGRMMAAVFSMHAGGQLLASVVVLVVLISYGKSRDLQVQPASKATGVADAMWRIIIGVGGIPILIGLPCSLTVPETIRYTLATLRQDTSRPREDIIWEIVHLYYDGSVPPVYSKEPHRGEVVQMPSVAEAPLGNEMVQNRPPAEGMFEALSLYSPPRWDRSMQRAIRPPSSHGDLHVVPTESSNHQDWDENGAEEVEEEGQENEEQQPEFYNPFSVQHIRRYFWVEENWRYLASLSLSGFFLHTAFSVLGTFDYRLIAQIWASKPSANNSTSLPSYTDGQSISPVAGMEIYNVLFDTATRSLITVSAASILGSLLAVKLIDYVPRRKTLYLCSLILVVLLIVTGSVFSFLSHTTYYATLVVLYALAQLVFSLGLGIVLFMIPAEIFPTRYRSTCYGLVFAAGTIGTIFGEVIASNSLIRTRGILIAAFSVFPALAALFSWGWLPDVQFRHKGEGDRIASIIKLRNRNLEELGRGFKGTREGEEKSEIGPKRFSLLWNLLRRYRS